MTTKKVCACGRRIQKTEWDQCAPCRRSSQRQPCVKGCGETATNGNTVCADCRDAEEVEATKVKGWVRGPRGTLVGSSEPCSLTLPCLAHAFCEVNKEVAA